MTGPSAHKSLTLYTCMCVCVLVADRLCNFNSYYRGLRLERALVFFYWKRGSEGNYDDA